MLQKQMNGQEILHAAQKTVRLSTGCQIRSKEDSIKSTTTRNKIDMNSSVSKENKRHWPMYGAYSDLLESEAWHEPSRQEVHVGAVRFDAMPL
ncbi:hypothetical protein WAI453_010080 [Rhynchosporium graminicola]